MTMHYPNPALDAELAYRREVLAGAARPARSGRRTWLPGRKRQG